MSMLLFFKDTAPTAIYTLSLHDALPICDDAGQYANSRHGDVSRANAKATRRVQDCERGIDRFPVHQRLTRSEEHTSELQSQFHLVCRLLLEKKKKQRKHCPAILSIAQWP